MPKVYLTEADREMAAREAGNEHIRMMAAAYFLREETNKAQLGYKMGLCRPSIGRKMQDPGLMTLEEFRTFIKLTKMRDSDLLKCIRGREG